MNAVSSRPVESGELAGASAAPAASVARPWRLTVGWEVAGEAPALAPDEVRVILAPIERPPADVADLAATLEPEERAQAERFRFPADRWRFTVCRGLVRRWLAPHLGLKPEEIRFVHGVNGKPAVAGAGASAGVRFNLSHAAGLAACAITHVGEVGVDLEQVHNLPGWEQISVLCFAPAERAALAAQPDAERLRHFFRLWTRHEAWLKAWGIGLGAHDVAPAGDDAWARSGDAGSLETFEPAPGYLATVAVLAPDAAAR
jgi:4'-phosphopantetheinyl transferase